MNEEDYGYRNEKGFWIPNELLIPKPVLKDIFNLNKILKIYLVSQVIFFHIIFCGL